MPGRAWLWLVVVAVLGVAAGTRAQDPLQRAVELGDPEVLPLVRETIRVTIDHQHASTTVQRIFRNRTSARTEGRFAYQAGEGATVTGFSYWNGEQRIVGEVFEKQVARQVYDQTVARAADPGLLETDGEGSFSFKVFPIEPSEDKRVELQLQQWLPRRRGTVEYTLPVGLPDADIDVVLEDARGLRALSSPTHTLTKSAAGDNRVRVRARAAAGGKPSQLVLRWQPDDDAEVAGGRVFPLRAYVHRDAGQDAYVVLALAAVPAVDRSAVVPKDVTLVIDHSGSMSGEPLERARAAASDVIRRLAKTDRLNVILFDDAVDLLYNRPKPVTEATRREAIEFVERMIDGGGTDLASALSTAFKAQHDDTRPKNLLFVTDGRSDSQAALAAAKDEKRDVRVFALGLGEGVEKPLLTHLAKLKRGQFTFVESPEVLESRVASVYRHIEAPVVVGLELQADGPTLTQMYPPTLPDLFQADELRIVARVRGSGAMTLALSGRDAAGPVRMVATVVVPKAAHRPWVGRLWANARIDHLGEQIALRGESAELLHETIELALAYDVVTPYTSFLAIPESELTWETARTLAEARERKQKVRARLEEASAYASAEPAFDGDYSRVIEHAEAPALSSRRDGASDDAINLEVDAIRGKRRGAAGCASCRAGADPGALALLFPLLALGWRRRRARG